MAATRRFIAGARCPGCGAVDTVYILKDGDAESLLCTRCEFREDKPVATGKPSGVWEPVKMVEGSRGGAE